MNEKKHWEHREKLSSGIKGFDDITCRGLPLARTLVLMGGPASGEGIALAERDQMLQAAREEEKT